MSIVSTTEKRFLFILGLITFLALVAISVSIWSVGSLKYQIESSKHLENKVKSIQYSYKSQRSSCEESISQLHSSK